MPNIDPAVVELLRQFLDWYDRDDATDDQLEQIVCLARELVQESEPSELESAGKPASSRKYVLYDFDLDELATTQVYASYSDAVADAEGLNNVLILKLPQSAPRIA